MLIGILIKIVSIGSVVPNDHASHVPADCE